MLVVLYVDDVVVFVKSNKQTTSLHLLPPLLVQSLPVFSLFCLSKLIMRGVSFPSFPSILPTSPPVKRSASPCLHPSIHPSFYPTSPPSPSFSGYTGSGAAGGVMLDNYLVFGASRGVWSLPGLFSLLFFFLFFLFFLFFFFLFFWFAWWEGGCWGQGCYMQKGGA